MLPAVLFALPDRWRPVPGVRKRTQGAAVTEKHWVTDETGATVVWTCSRRVSWGWQLRRAGVKRLGKAVSPKAWTLVG